MCGRYTRTADRERLVGRFCVERVETDLFGPRYNVAPSQDCLVVDVEDGRRVLRAMRWGLVPSWAKDPSPGPINARAETLAEKPMFRRLLRSRRCLVPADGFYEWKKVPGTKAKQPYRFVLEGGGVFAFAGLWDLWQAPGGTELRTFAIVTTTPNDLVRPIHNRMPVILRKTDEETWLASGSQGTAPLLAPYPEAMKTCLVSTKVNSPAMDEPLCLEAIYDA